jgi:nucleotide-binding universal stress UspA family protein
VTYTATLPEFNSKSDLSFTDLLVAYDFSAAASTALEYAAELSRCFGSTIHLINVETPDEHARLMNTEPRVREHTREDVQRAFDNIEKHLRARGIPCDSVHRVGEVSGILEGAVLEAKTDLLLLGAFGHGSVDRPGLGSTAEQILRVARCPVLTIGPKSLQSPAPSRKIERLICVITCSEDHHDLLTFSGSLAAAAHGHLEILQVVNPKHCAGAADEKARHCEAWSRILRDCGIHVNWTVLYGAPDQVTVARAAEMKASLIVMRIDRATGDGSAPLSRALINTIQKAHCPVLTVPSGESCNSPNHTFVSARSM